MNIERDKAACLLEHLSGYTIRRAFLIKVPVYRRRRKKNRATSATLQPELQRAFAKVQTPSLTIRIQISNLNIRVVLFEIRTTRIYRENVSREDVFRRFLTENNYRRGLDGSGIVGKLRNEKRKVPDRIYYKDIACLDDFLAKIITIADSVAQESSKN